MGRKKEVIGYVIKTKKWLQFESLTHAADHFNIDVTQVSQVINGTFKKCKGVCFYYNTDDFHIKIAEKLSKPNNNGHHSKKAIIAIDANGVKTRYTGIGHCSRELGLSKTTVSRCVNGFRECSSYSFEYDK